MVVGWFPKMGNEFIWSSLRGLHPCRFMISGYVWSLEVEQFWMLLWLFSWGCKGDHTWHSWHLEVFVEGHATCLWFAISFFGLGYLLGCLGSRNIVFWDLLELCGHLLSLVLHYFLVMTWWLLYLFSLLDVENMGELWRLDERDVSCSVSTTGFAYLCGWSLVLHGFTFFVLLSVDSVCHWFFRFDITHAAGVLVCVWSSSTILDIELEVAVYGLVMLLAWVF